MRVLLIPTMTVIVLAAMVAEPTAHARAADAGAGDSDLVWTVLAGLNYRFEKVDVAFGYRHMAWEFDDSDTFDDLDISGPYLGMRVHF